MAKLSRSPSRKLIEILVVLALILGCAFILANAGAFKPKEGYHRLTFRVSSAGGFANITLNAAENHIDNSQTLTTPWERTFDIASGVTVFLTARNPSQSGQLSCVILLDNSDWKKSTINAPKDGVACAGIVP